MAFGYRIMPAHASNCTIVRAHSWRANHRENKTMRDPFNFGECLESSIDNEVPPGSMLCSF